MNVFYHTDIGMKRMNNEDSVNVAYNHSQQQLFIVCDGVGGQKFGEVASQMTVNYLTKEWEKTERVTETTIKSWYIETLNHINETIYNQSTTFSDLKGMSTTVVCACVVEQQLVVAHVGDSRAYVFRFPQIKQVTRDHSLVNYLIDRNEISETEAFHHPMKNIITRAVGSDSFVDVELTYVTLQEDDIILLCSDGVSDLLDDDMLTKIFSQSIDIEEMGKNLIRVANYKGGLDNISVVVTQFKQKAVK